MSGEQDPPDLRDERLNLYGLILVVQRGLSRVAADAHRPHGLIGTEFEALLRLARSQGEQLRMTDLAAQTGSSGSGLTAMIGRLEGAGLVIRRPSTTDRRSNVVAITAKGREVLDAAVRDVLPVLDGLLLQAWGDDRDVVVRALERQRDALRDRH